MIFSRGARKLALTAHVAGSVGWFGAVSAFLVLAIAGVGSSDAELARSAYSSMRLIAWWMIVPLCLASLVSGVVQSLGSRWGLLRHYWVVAKLAATVIATLILIRHLPTIDRAADAAAAGALSAELGQTRLQLLVHAAGGLAVLLVTTAVSVYKPRGLTRYGARLERGRSGSADVRLG